MLKTTLGQLLVNSTLPPDLRDYNRKLDKKGTASLFQDIATKYPEQYKDLSKKLFDIGRDSATESGGYSFGIDHLMTPEKTVNLRNALQSEIDNIYSDKKLNHDEKKKRIIELVSSKTKELEDTTFEEATKANNPLAMQVTSGARGNKGNIRSVLSGDLMYEDPKGNPLPIPIMHSYSEGLSPIEYWAGTFGTRKGVADLKFATQEGGYLAKQLNQITHRLVITGKDADKESPTLRGLPVDTDDADNEGALLAAPAGGYKRNTPLTPKILTELKSKGHDRILIRSPMVGGHPEGGLYAADVGIRERGGLPAPGDNVGMAAAQALCLDEDTMVRMADGTDKAIKDIQIGDWVLSADGTSTLFSVRVLDVFDNGPKECYEFFFNVEEGEGSGDISLVCTMEHKILTRKPMIQLKSHRVPEVVMSLQELLASPVILGAVLENGQRAIYKRYISAGLRRTRDIHVDCPNHLFVLSNGMIVSNSEPVSQSLIGSKHAGGVAGAGKTVGGFKYINQLIQVPKTFTAGASHAQTDGKVGTSYDAPAGGKYLMINGVRHYISTGMEPKVKQGDTVEAGDVISEGLPNPAEIVRHKGIGEGRRYFVNTIRKVFNDSNLKAHRRNIELLSRGLINHVKLHESMGDFIPDDIVPYDVLEHHYEPREGSDIVRSNSAAGKYLEQPALHYSIGTRVTPSVTKELEHWGIKHVNVHPDPPPFEPIMIRGAESLLHDPDWMTRHLGINLRKGMLNAAHRGATSDETGTSFVASLARGVDFGRIGKTKGYDPKEITKPEDIK